MAAILLGDRRLTDLKVTELKAELDKRGLPKKGVKSVLIDRLKKAILQEELSNVNAVDDEESGFDTTADISIVSQEESEADISRVEAAAPADRKAPSTSATVEPVTDKVPVVEPELVAVGEGEIMGALSDQVTEQQNSETEQEMPGPISTKTVTKEIDMITMETKEAVAVEEEKSQSNQPMDLGSPLDSDPEFDLLPGEQDESVDTLTTNEEYAASTSATEDLNTSVKEDVTEEETAEQTGDEEREGETRRDGTEERKGEDEKDEEEDSSSSSGGKRVDRLDSTFDSSYEPATEELLYEGDPDAEAKHDPSQDASTAEGDVSLLVGDREKTADTSVTDKREEEEGFMVEVHYKDQGGSLEDPAAAVIGSTPLSKEDLEEKGGKPSPSVTGKTPGDSSRMAGCHLWVAGLVSSVRALDLQTLFSSFGQVLSAKVVAKAQSKARFGYVTMGTRDQAQKCISQLNGTELKGNIIHVELAKTAPPLSNPSETKLPIARRSSPLGAATRGGKSGGASKNGHDSLRDKDKVGPSITTKSPVGSGGEGKGGVKGRDDRRRLSGSSRYHGDDRSRRSRSPPLRRSPRGRTGGRVGRTSPPPRSSAAYIGSSIRAQASHTRDARDDIIRREEQRRDLMERRLGDPYYRDGSRQVMMDDRRFADRYQELAARRQLELEHTRREQEMARRMQEVREREAREREIRERQIAEQERVFKERERVMREREYRERQRREQLEKELRERDQREKDFRERERRLREQHIRELQDREMKAARDRELREREVQAQVQRERELREKEERLLQEHQRIQKEKQLYEEQQRRLREEAERQAREREREAREREVRERERKMEVERERRLREEKERERERREREEERQRIAKLEREREQKRKQEELKWAETESRILQQQRLGKRSGYQDSPGYDIAKRQTVHDIRSGNMRGAGGSGGVDLYDISSSVFSRLDPQKQAAAEARMSQLGSGLPGVSGVIPGSSGGGKTTISDTYGRRGVADSGGTSGSGGYRTGGYSVGGGGGMGRGREGVSYPIPTLNKGGQNSSQGYQKPGTLGGGVSVVSKSGSLAGRSQDIISAALAIQKTVGPGSSVASQMRMAGSSPIQQSAHISPGGMGDFMNRGEPMGGQMPMGGVTRQMMGGGGGGMGPMVKGAAKLPPMEERYNRRFSRPPHAGRQANMKRF